MYSKQDDYGRPAEAAHDGISVFYQVDSVFVQVYPVYTCSARRLEVRRCSTPRRGNSSGAATSTPLRVWMGSSLGSPSEQRGDFLFR